MPGKWVDIDVSGENMEAYVAEPEAEGKYPAVIVIQEVWGANSHIQMVTDRLPSQGFVGLAPQMFHREGPMIMALHEERETAFGRAGRVTDDGILADINAAVSYLQSQPNVDGDRIGIVGFCFGGRVSYLAATSVAGIGAAAVFYGGGMLQPRGEGPSPLERSAGINCPILGLFGEDDGNPTPADVATIQAELDRLGKTYEFHMYPGAGHAFHCDSRESFRLDAAADAWRKTITFFNQHLKA